MRSRTIHLAFLFAILLAAGSGPSRAADISEERLEGLEWRMIGPWRGGRVTAVAGHPSDPLFYLMGSTGGGVWKTTDGGKSWEVISDKGFTSSSVGAIAIAPSDPNVIVIGMGESPVRGVASHDGDGVWRSTDRGRSFERVGLADSRHIGAVVIHPRDPETFWVAAQGAAYGPNAERGVHKTTDGGKSFRRVLFVDENTGAVDLSIDPANPRFLIAAMWDWGRTPNAIRSGGPGSGIWRSEDGGETWKKLTKDLPDLMGKIGVAISPARAGRIYALIEAKEKGGVWRSDDFGESWTRVNATRRVQARSWYYMHIHADPKNADTVYVQNAPMLKSTDGGKTFEGFAEEIHGDHHDFWINPENPAIMIDGNDGGAAVSMDGGKSWSSQHNQPTGQFYRVAVDHDLFYRVYGGQQDNSTVAIYGFSPDGAIGRDDYHPVGGCESAHVAFDPDDPRDIYAGCYLGQIDHYDAATRTVRDIRAYPELAFGVPAGERKYRFNWNAPILVSQHDPRVVYHGGNVLFRSTDKGESWQAISPDLTRNAPETLGPGGFPITNEVSENYHTILALAESPHDAKLLYVGTDDGLLHVTRDGGASWTDITPKGAGAGLVNAIEVSPHDPSVVYVAFSRYRHEDHSPLLYRLTDFGRRAVNVDRTLPEGHWVRVGREDPVRKGLLYAGTEYGLFVSWNEGKSWQPLRAGEFPVVPVTDIKVHGDDLVVATSGRAFWVLDDITPLRSLDGIAADAPLHLFAPKTARMMQIAGRGHPDDATSPNPPAGAIIYYLLGDEPDLGKTSLKLEIRDEAGELVRTLATDEKTGVKGGGSGSAYRLPAKKGLNRAIWDFRRDPLEQKLGGFVIAGGGDGLIDGAQIAPGRYRLRLILGETVREADLDVVFDPRIPVEAEAFSAQQALVGDTRAMLDEFQSSVLALRSLGEQAALRKTLAEKAGKTTLAEAAARVVDAVKDWEKGVLSGEREFFQDVLNWPDRLFSDLEFLHGDLDQARPRLTAGLRQRHADVRARFEAAMAARDDVLEGAVAEFNRLFAEANEPGLETPALRSGK